MSKYHFYSSVNTGIINSMSISNKSAIKAHSLGYPRIGAKFYE